MSTLNLTRDQQKILLPLISRLDTAAYALGHAVGQEQVKAALEEYHSAYRALWSACGGRF